MFTSSLDSRREERDRDWKKLIIKVEPWTKFTNKSKDFFQFSASQFRETDSAQSTFFAFTIARIRDFCTIIVSILLLNEWLAGGASVPSWLKSQNFTFCDNFLVKPFDKRHRGRWYLNTKNRVYLFHLKFEIQIKWSLYTKQSQR